MATKTRAIKDTKQHALTRDAFLDRYGPYFGVGRMQAIAKTGRFLIEESAEGPYIFDTEGRQFLDLLNAGGVSNLGHRNPVMLKAMIDATERQDFGSLFHFSESKGRLAEALARTTPAGLEVSMPAVTGSEAIDEAVKIARGATGRAEILHWEGSYHGHTGISLTMMYADAMREWAEPLVPEIRKIKFDDIESLRNSVSERTAAVVVEPVRTAAGGHKPSTEYFAELRRLCDRFGAKLIVDEVVTGMGRLGHVWGCDYDNIKPDLLVTGKGFSGGMYPIAAVIMRPELLEFWGDNPWRSLSSYAWSNIGSEVARVAIEETERLLPQANNMGDELAATLNGLARRYPDVVTGIRRIGLLFAMEFNGDKLQALDYANRMFELGVIVVVSASNVNLPSVRFYPPLVMESAHIAELADKSESVIKSVSDHR